MPPRPTPTIQWDFLSPRLAFCLGVTAASAALGQTVLPKTVPDDGKDTIITLSPFEVSSELDKGYQANGTLSGTRLRTDLRDVAASVSVITKDFMRDINANDLEGLLVYTVGTEVDGLGGNFSGSFAATDGSAFQNFDIAIRSPTSTTRVRGLSSADTTRDFAPTSIPTDNYNVERVEISRGPAAMLFGLGSPAGIVNMTLIQADTRKNKAEFRTQLSDYGSVRESIDLNRVLLKDRLAVRLAAVHSDQSYQQETKFSRTGRVFGTITYRPTRSTTIRFNTENGDAKAAKPRTNPPFDSFSWWWNIGKPSYDPTTGVMTYLGTRPTNPDISPTTSTGAKNGSIINTGFGSSWNTNVGIIFENPNTSTPGLSTPGGVQALKAVWDRYRLSGTTLVSDGLSTLMRSATYLNALHKNDITTNFWKVQQVADPSIFDYYRQTIDGPDNNNITHWRTYSATVEQLFFGGKMGIELNFDRQDMWWSFRNPTQNADYTVYLDINSKLMDGTPNPNYLRPVTADVGWSESDVADRKAARATAYYNLDLRKLSGPKWLGQGLGRHVFTGTFTQQTLYKESAGGRENLMGLDYFASEQATNSGLSITSNAGPRQVDRVTYLGPSVVNAAGPTNTGLQGLVASHALNGRSNLNVLYYQAPPAGINTPANPQVRQFTVLQEPEEDKIPLAYNVSRTNIRTKSTSFVTQSFWLESTLVSTLGWRRDQFVSFDAGQPAYDPATGLRIVDSTFYPKRNLTGSKNSFSWGVVGHLPARIERRLPLESTLSAFYNKADNFAPTAQRYDVYNQPTNPNKGATEEYGGILTLWRGKFDLRVTHYETTSLYSTAGSLRNVLKVMAQIPQGMENQIANNPNGYYTDSANAAGTAAWNVFMASPAGLTTIDTFRFAYKFPNAVQGQRGTLNSVDTRADIVVETNDATSRGWEYELTYNPTKSWRIGFGASRSEAMQANTGPSLRRFVEQNYVPLIAGPAGALSTTNTSTGETLKQKVTRQILVPMYTSVLQDGSPSSELRKWHWSVVTNYRFTEGRLKGWNVSANVRWQDRAAIGLPVKIDDTGLVRDSVTGVEQPVYDVKHPYYGPATTNYGMQVGYQRRIWRDIRWSAQLNVKNIGVGNKLIPVSAQPDGSIAAWRIAEPMTWSLSNSFEF